MALYKSIYLLTYLLICKITGTSPRPVTFLRLYVFVTLLLLKLRGKCFIYRYETFTIDRQWCGTKLVQNPHNWTKNNKFK